MMPFWILLLAIFATMGLALLRMAYFWARKNSKNAEVQQISRQLIQAPSSATLSGSQSSAIEDFPQEADPESALARRPHPFTGSDLRRAFVLKTLLDEPKWRD